MDKKMKVSVVIPTFNSSKTIEKCLKSVINNKYQNFEVIVVDDGSKDDTIKIIKNLKIKLFFTQGDIGASVTRNLGIKKASGELIIFLDPDTYVPADWINKHVDVHNKMDVDILGGGVIGIHNTIWGMCDGYCNWWTSVPYSKSRYLKKLHIPTNNMSIKHSVISKIGYFDETLFKDKIKCGGEDAEFCHRALKNGLKIFFKSDIVVRHFDRDDYAGYIKHQYNWGLVQVNRKKRGMGYSYFIPNSYITAWFLILPLAILYTGFIIMGWVKYDPKIILYIPLILKGKITQTVAIKNSLKKQEPTSSVN